MKGLAARVYVECDEATDRQTLATRLGIDLAELEAVVAPLIKASLLLDFDGRLLALCLLARPGAAGVMEAEQPHRDTRPQWASVRNASSSASAFTVYRICSRT